MNVSAIPVSTEPAARHDSPARRATPHRLSARTVSTWALDDEVRAAAFELFASAYDGADRARFESDLDEKQLVILLEDDESRLRGFSTVLLREADAEHGRATVVFSGDTVIDPAYWGQKRLQSEFARLLLELKLRHPLRPLFWFLISKGYRTYLLLANAFPRAVPRCDRADDAELRRFRDALALERFGADFDADRGIVRHAAPHERVRDGLAPVTDALLGNRHVRFFAERNPGHARGEELVCLAEVRLADLARLGMRMMRRRAVLRWTGSPTSSSR